MEAGEPKPNSILWLLIILVLAVFSAAAMYFGSDNKDLSSTIRPSVNLSSSSRQPRLYTVYYSLGVFSPTNIRIHVGDSVKFQNDSILPIRIVPDPFGGAWELASFNSINDIPPKGYFTFTFTEPGTFGYRNARNPSEKGTVIVRPQ
jgi:hypothetical protein